MRSGRHGAILFLVLGYFALGAMSIAISRFDGGVSSIWLANAFAIVWTLTRPIALHTALAVVAATSIGINLIAGLPLGASAFASFLNVFETGAALFALRWWFGDQTLHRPGTPEHSVVFFGLAGIAAPLLTALLAGPILFHAAGWPSGMVAHQWFSASFLGSALVIPSMVLAATRNSEAPMNRRRSLVFAGAFAGTILVACVALGSYIYPFFAIGLYLLATTVFLTRFEVSLLSIVGGSVAIIMALAGLVPGFETGVATFSNRFHISLGFALVFPVFVSILLWRIRCHQKEVADSEELFRRAMEDSAIGMAIVQLGGRISKANARLAEMLGYTVEELEGKSFFELTYPDDKHLGFKVTKEVLAGRQATYKFEKRYVRKDGTPVWTQTSGSVIWDEGGDKPRFLVSQIENIDERKKAQQTIVEAENRWNFALNSARQGVWDLDRRKGRTYYSPMWKEMLGYGDDDLGDDPGLWLTLIHPEDRQRALALETAHLDGQTQFFEAEFRMRHKHGHWIWVLDRGKTIERDEDGHTVRAIGTHTDITAQKRAQARLAETAAALRAEKERLRVTLHAIGDAVICTDASETVSFMNTAAEALTGRTADESIGRPLEYVYCPRDEETNEVISVADEAADGKARAHNRAVIIRPDGSRSSIRQIVSPIVTEGQVSNGSVIVFQDVTDARTLQRQLAYAASHDSLTGLANRANFLATMRELLDEVRGDDGAQHQLLFIDLDRFKTVNDRAGHGAGDALLKRIASVLRGSVRRTDVVARLGGDEFALILRHTDVETAVKEAERVISLISMIEFAWEGEDFNVGASVGVAPITGDASAVDEIIANADRGCYAAKSAGRGTVAVHGARAA
jgi:diguanylate cyclase (GGDEF)-like protein/PAS domain S-box-containing protein